MRLKTWSGLLGILLLGCFSGCAGAEKERLTSLVNQLQMENDHLKGDLSQRNNQIQGLSVELNRVQQANAQLMNERKTDARSATAYQIQTALQKAGFYTGTIDGKIGERTKAAVMEFQKARNLKVDGLIGQETWEQLIKYLE